MDSPRKLSQSARQLLRCPVCHAELLISGEVCKCNNPSCARTFPLCGGVPILINEEKSVFTINEILATNASGVEKNPESRIRQQLHRYLPKISINIKAKRNYEKLNREILEKTEDPRVLVVGGSIIGQGMDAILGNTRVDLVETDVAFGPRSALICDAHDLPFADQAFDLVIIQAVLEHVVDPCRCCEEVFRVLKTPGYVYAETPFMQQVHGGAHDFTRFTHLGHRWLFRRFNEIESGAVCGPGMALAWSYQHFLLSFTTSPKARSGLSLLARLTAFYLKYFDYYLIDKPGALDAASGFYFIGEKSDKTMSDKELTGAYRGAKR